MRKSPLIYSRTLILSILSTNHVQLSNKCNYWSTVSSHTIGKKSTKYAIFAYFPKFKKIKPRSSLKLPTYIETHNNMQSGETIENRSLPCTFLAILRSFTPPIILRLKTQGISERHPVQRTKDKPGKVMFFLFRIKTKCFFSLVSHNLWV